MMKFLKLLFLACILMAPYHSARGKVIPLKPVESCQATSPYHFPTVKSEILILCRSGYVAGYDPIAKIPNWTLYSFNENKAIGCLPRSESYYVDEILPANVRAFPNDYSRTGYDIGHMANAADMAWSNESMEESFLMSNMTPQTPTVNRGIWKSIETATRTWAVSRKSTLIIISGSIYNKDSLKIGRQVVVPNSIYKIIIDTKTKSYMAFVVSQTSVPNSLESAQTTISNIEKSAKIRIFVPRGLVKSKKDPLWVITLPAYQKIKKQSCSVN